MQQTAIALDENLCFLLSQAARAFTRDLQARLHRFGVTPPQFIVLTCLWEEDGLAASLLGERAGFDGPTITGILDRLERQELVVRRRGSEDRRIVTVHLTERGEALRERLPGIAHASQAAALAGLDAAHLALFRRILRHMSRNLEAASAGAVANTPRRK